MALDVGQSAAPGADVPIYFKVLSTLAGGTLPEYNNVQARLLHQVLRAMLCAAVALLLPCVGGRDPVTARWVRSGRCLALRRQSLGLQSMLTALATCHCAWTSADDKHFRA